MQGICLYFFSNVLLFGIASLFSAVLPMRRYYRGRLFSLSTASSPFHTITNSLVASRARSRQAM
jgi:hypothetical protein